MAFKLMFTDEQLRQLRSSQKPKLDAQANPVLSRGRVVLEPNPGGEPWRFLDASPDAPQGFGVYVGKTKATYEVQRRINGRVMRFKVGDTRTMTRDAAHLRAMRLLKESTDMGVHPKALDKEELTVEEWRQLTVNGAILMYRKMLANREQPASDGTLHMLDSVMMRLDRKEVGLGQVPIMKLTEGRVKEAFQATRLSCATNSNRVPKVVRDYMASVKRVDLTDDELRQFGMDTEAKRLRIRAAGVSAAEQTFASAFRAVRYAMEKEARAAKKADRKPVLLGNDFGVLWEEGKMRTAADLHVYYEKARVRNPLGQQDDTLGTALEYIWSRRIAQRGQNESGAYYLLATLFLGARRNETAKLAWYDRVPEDERGSVSWVWLDDMDRKAKREGRPSVNPTTGKSGPQVFFAKTKNRRDHNMPLGPFSLQLFKHRFERRLPTSDRRAKWVFPARNHRAKDGHYKDSKAIMKGLGKQLPMEFGPTPHDLRRTLGRYAGKLGIPDRITSRLFNHLPPKKEDPDGGAATTRRYQEPEWYELQEALSRVEQLMASSAPAFYNQLKPVDWPLLPENK